MGTTTSADQQLMLISVMMWYSNVWRGGESIPGGVLVGGEEGYLSGTCDNFKIIK